VPTTGPNKQHGIKVSFICRHINDQEGSRK
jgi:hypothetical protein